jgi:hypothetical protein
MASLAQNKDVIGMVQLCLISLFFKLELFKWLKDLNSFCSNLYLFLNSRGTHFCPVLNSRFIIILRFLFGALWNGIKLENHTCIFKPTELENPKKIPIISL